MNVYPNPSNGNFTFTYRMDSSEKLSFEMINAENELTQAKTNYLNALYNLNVAKIDFDKALGNL